MHKKDAQKIIARNLQIADKTAENILDKALAGKEFSDDSDLERWLNERFLPNVIFIDEDGYAKMCIDALKILKSTSATDFGSSRQRDLGQLWGDMT